MKQEEIPQDNLKHYEGNRRAVYALDSSGRVVMGVSNGWKAEEAVTQQALQALEHKARQIHADVCAGRRSPLAWHMCCRMMDVALLASTSGIWSVFVRWHMRPGPFRSLKPKTLKRYAEALDVTPAELMSVPMPYRSPFALGAKDTEVFP